MWFTDFPLGIGMCMMTDCMHTFSPLIQIDYGGIGALTIFTDPDGASAGDGLHRGIIAVGIPIIGMAVTGVEAIGVAIGDIITITIPVTTRLQVDIIQTDVPLIEIIALMRVAEVPVIQVGGAVALLP